MTVSSLCSYVNLTSKCNPREYSITRITPHQMAAGWTGSHCADYFCSSARECSSNYCIGYGGDIAQNVDEDYRAWTSSSWDNDQRAITVEISNSYTGTDEMTDASIEAFIQLCVDLFHRYPTLGDKLVYDGTTNGNLTLHEMFSSTNCPGWYFKSKIGYIVSEVNRRLTGEEQSTMMYIQNGGAIYSYDNRKLVGFGTQAEFAVVKRIYGGSDPVVFSDDELNALVAWIKRGDTETNIYNKLDEISNKIDGGVVVEGGTTTVETIDKESLVESIKEALKGFVFKIQ